jgi:hypothetical protein
MTFFGLFSILFTMATVWKVNFQVVTSIRSDNKRSMSQFEMFLNLFRATEIMKFLRFELLGHPDEPDLLQALKTVVGA